MDKTVKEMIEKLKKKSCRRMKQLDYVRHKTIDRTKDSFFNFTHAHLIRNMVTASELDLVRRRPCDQKLIWIAFYPTGGFGDYIISSKLLDELLLHIPCRIDVYCEHVAFGHAVYAERPAVQVLPYDSLHANRFMYDLVLCVEHFIHVWSWNAHHVAKIAPEFADKVHVLGSSMQKIRPDIEQQCFREALHFQRSRLLGMNRWTELRHGTVFEIPDQYTYVHLKSGAMERIREIGLAGARYVTVNRGADSMGRSGTQTKVWPLEHYEELVRQMKQRFSDIQVIQLGTKGNSKIIGADMHLLEENMEVTKWLLRGSMLHIDCEGGLVHLAVQLAVPCIVLFGPTPLHMYAYPQNINLVSKRCSGCMGVYPDWAFDCYRGLKQPECMASLTPAYVMSFAEKYLLDRNTKTEEERKKDLLRIQADAWQTADCGRKTQDQDMADIQAYSRIQEYKKLYECCRRRNPLLTMSQADVDLYAAVLKQTETCLEPAGKIALIGVKRDFIGWYLQEKGFDVTEFDPDYGYSGRIGDTSFNRFTAACIKHGMDMRLGDRYQIPYASESFDLAVVFFQNRNSSCDREAERILKQGGCLIWKNRIVSRKGVLR